MPTISEYSPRVHLVALCTLTGVSPRLFELLFARFGDTERILRADVSALTAIGGMSAPQIKRIASARDRLEDAQRFVNRLTEREIRVISFFDDDYGELLTELNDPPPILYIRGVMPDRSRKSVTVAGAHNATAEGIELTTNLARRFGQAGVQVISSLRGGIDSAAHLGAKSGGAPSFAVIDTGFDQLTAPSAMPLAIDIVEHGGVISEYAPEQISTHETLEQSNRLLAGLAQAVVVTEVYSDSEATLDLLAFCRMIGKLVFVMADPHKGALADESAMAKALEAGAIPMKGLEHTDDIVRALV
ncbi:MAG: DNA-processing protein DprA [candidate division Zixibacteria bacterium]|nr:DNA-processing protein DprA [candidate division Zixibacteria bacterium]